jgi:biopolymer transport protein ExbB
MNSRKRFVAVILVAAVLLPTITAAAQDMAAADAPAVAENAEVNEPPPEQSLGGMVVSGGTLNIVFFGILGVFSLWAVTVILERVVNLRRENLLPSSFESGLKQIVQRPQSGSAEFQRLCETNDAPAARIFQAGVTRAGRPLPEVEKAMEDAAAREMATLRAKSRPLSVVGSIAPLVGLLGTVVGMIMAFQISSQEGLGKAERLAEGIYLALMTTAAGLSIAIPCLLFVSWFQARAERFMCEIADCLITAVPSFARMEGKPVAATTPAVIGGAPEDADLSPREKFLREGIVETAKA